MQDVDTNATMEINGSPIWPAIAAIMFGALFLVTASLFVNTLGRFLGAGRMFDGTLSATVFSGLAAVALGGLTHMCGRDALRGFAPVVFLSPEGYRDIRVSPEIIPWADIRLIKALGRHVHFYLSPPMTDRVLGKPGPWRSLKAFSHFGAGPVFPTHTNTLAIDALGLERIARQYWKAHGEQKAP